jgi:hypothetical protein
MKKMKRGGGESKSKVDHLNNDDDDGHDDRGVD